MSQAATTGHDGRGCGVRPSYLAVGHVTVDVMADGERRPGGTALYSALQAARLGLEATIHTRGAERELRKLLSPYADELQLVVEPAAETTTFRTEGLGEERRQRLLAWAGPIAAERLPAAGILHLAPVAAELAALPAGEWGFVGLTPQGLARGWSEPGAEVVPQAPAAPALGLFARSDAVVLSRGERLTAADGVQLARRSGALVAVTAGPASTLVLEPGGGETEVAPAAAPDAVDDLGAGDVFAATLFVELAGGATPRQAAIMGGAAAAVRLRAIGPGAIGRRAEIEAQATSAESSSSLSSPGPS
jgi:sugar/nucleoside kinase (ribokinase family)